MAYDGRDKMRPWEALDSHHAWANSRAFEGNQSKKLFWNRNMKKKSDSSRRLYMKGPISSPACAWLNSQCYYFINGSSQWTHCGSEIPYTASQRPVSSSVLSFSASSSSLARQSGGCGTSLWTQNAMSFEMFISLILLWSSRLISPS